MDAPELPSLDLPDLTPTPIVTTTSSSNVLPPVEIKLPATPTPVSEKSVKRKSSVINVLHSTPRWKQFLSTNMGDRSATQNLVQVLNELEQLVLSEQASLQNSKNHKIKNGAKMLKCLEDLSYFQLGNFFAESQTLQRQLWKMLQILFSFNIEERAFLQYLYLYSLNYLSLEGGDRDSLLFIMKKEMTTSNLVLKCECLESMGVLYSVGNKTQNPLLKETSLSLLSKYVQSEATLKKSKLKSLFHIADAKDEEIHVISSCLLSLAVAPNEMDLDLLKDIYTCARHKNDEVAKQSILLLSRVAVTHYNSILFALFKYIPKFKLEMVNGKREIKEMERKEGGSMLNIGDPFARIGLIKLASFALQYENPLGQEECLPWILFLKYMIHDRRLTCFFDSSVILASNYDVLNKDMEDIPNSLDSIIHKYTLILKQLGNNQLLTMSALRYLHQFMTLMIIQPFPKSIGPLLSHVKTLLYASDRYIRYFAFKILLTCPYVEIVKDAIIRLKLELKSNFVWNHTDIYNLMTGFFETCKSKIDYIELLTDIFSHICIYYPEKMEIASLLKVYNLFRDYTDISEYFLKMLFHILDEALRGSKQSFKIITTTYQFLGENANYLTRESDELSRKNVLDTRFIQKLTVHDALKDPNVYDIQNLALKSIVLRLIKGSMFSHARLECVEGLGKIAIRARDPTRLHIFEVLLNMNDNDFGTSFYLVPIIQILNDIYKLKISMKKCQTDQDCLSFYETHQKLTERAAIYCKLESKWIPCGEESTILLRKGLEVYKRENGIKK